MLNKDGIRMLSYLVRIDDIRSIEGADKVELAVVGGWTIMTRKGQFEKGDMAIYFEIDSKVPETEAFEFLASKHYKIKTQKYFKGTVISQGLLMAFEDFPDIFEFHGAPDFYWSFKGKYKTFLQEKGRKPYEDELQVNDDMTKVLGVIYSVVEDNKRKSNVDKYAKMAARHSKLFKTNKLIQWLYKRDWGKKLLFIFLGKKKDSCSGWPVGKFPGVSKTDQERIENMIWVLEENTPYIVTQKCDGSSGTYILERKHFSKYEFYVCSRNVRMETENQECFYGDKNYYWEVAQKYDIENKMKKILEENKDLDFICWQGEICAPAIQKNPHKLTETHFYIFHMTDNINGRYDMVKIQNECKKYNMECVPIVDTEYFLPKDFEQLKNEADGVYNPEVCEGNSNCMREGLVYYKVSDPAFSFKNVSRKYLLKTGQ